MTSLAVINRSRPTAAVASRLVRPTLPAPCGLGFVLFLVLNAVLFVRPAEIVPALLGLEIYLTVILLCLLASFPVLLEQLMPRSLESRPITVCVFGLLLAVVLSHLSHFDFDKALEYGWDFAKTILYYLLFVGLITTSDRLRTFLRCFVLFASAVAVLAVLQYHDVITLPNLNPIKDSVANTDTGKEDYIVRLRGSGIFQDPNELSILMGVSIVLALYWITDSRSLLLRMLMPGSLLLFGYALALTQSRGGMLALMAGLGILLQRRFGWMRALVLGLVLLPLLALFSARQTSLSTGAGTGQERIQLWSDGLMMVRQSPLFGIGMREYAKKAGLVAHNSYLHALAELGLLGGSCFAGAFALALESFVRLGNRDRQILDPELRRLYPYLFGVFTVYAVGMMSLSLNYIVPTYTVLGLALVYRRLAIARPPLPPARFDVPLAVRLGLLSIALVIGFTVFVRVLVVR